MKDQNQKKDYTSLQEYVNENYNGNYSEYAQYLQEHAFRLSQHALNVKPLIPNHLGIIAQDIYTMADTLMCIHIGNQQKI